MGTVFLSLSRKHYVVLPSDSYTLSAPSSVALLLWCSLCLGYRASTAPAVYGTHCQLFSTFQPVVVFLVSAEKGKKKCH